jgi:hypothetical protein
MTFEYENNEDELLEEPSFDSSVPDDATDEVAEAEEPVESVSGGVVWTRGENGRLKRV